MFRILKQILQIILCCILIISYYMRLLHHTICNFVFPPIIKFIQSICWKIEMNFGEKYNNVWLAIQCLYLFVIASILDCVEFYFKYKNFYLEYYIILKIMIVILIIFSFYCTDNGKIKSLMMPRCNPNPFYQAVFMGTIFDYTIMYILISLNVLKITTLVEYLIFVLFLCILSTNPMPPNMKRKEKSENVTNLATNTT